MATVLASAPLSQAVVASIAWHALAKAAAKEADRDQLASGASHRVELTLSGTVDGCDFEQHLGAILSVGHDSVRASSATPEVPVLVASILSKLNATTREAVLRELPVLFAENGNAFPEVDTELVKAAEEMLAKLRATKQTPVRGSVSCKYTLGAPTLSIVG